MKVGLRKKELSKKTQPCGSGANWFKDAAKKGKKRKEIKKGGTQVTGRGRRDVQGNLGGRNLREQRLHLIFGKNGGGRTQFCIWEGKT